jgi:hypothetical protein
MFAKAYDIATKFTHPLVVTMRFFDKTLDCGLGAFVVLNDEGWLITAAHNFGASFAFNQHQMELKEYNEKVERINSNKQIKDHKKRALAKAIRPNQKWITDFAIMLGGQTIAILEYHIHGEHDIAFIRIDKNAIKGQTVFPKLLTQLK